MKCRHSDKPTILLLYLNPLDWASLAAPPYGLEILRASIRDLDAEVAIYNPFLSENPDHEIRRLLALHSPVLVGLSFRNLDNMAHVWDETSPSCNGIQARSFLPEVQQASATIRHATESPIVIGGPGFSIAPVQLLERLGLTLGVTGPGEVTFRELARAVLRGQNVEQFAEHEAAHLPGLVVRLGDGRVVQTAPSATAMRSELSAIERVPEYSSCWTGTVPVRVGCGCAGSCSFCVEATGRYGQVWRDPALVVEEIRGLDHDETRGVWLACSELNFPDEGYALQLCEQIADADLPSYAYCSYFLPHPFSGSLYHALRDIGFADHSICFGLVHVSDSVLEQNRVSFRRRDIDRLVDVLVSSGARGLVAGMILGLPGETEKSLTEAADWVAEMDGLFGEGFRCFYNCGGRVYPGTGLEQIAESPLETERLYGDCSHGLLQPVVYSSPWNPRAVAEFFDSACAQSQGLVARYNRGDPMFGEAQHILMAWQRGQAQACANNTENAVAILVDTLKQVNHPSARAKFCRSLIPHLARLGQVGRLRGVLSLLDSSELNRSQDDWAMLVDASSSLRTCRYVPDRP